MAVDTLDHTHNPDRRSWVQSANREGTDFPVQNLPFGLAREPTGAVTPVIAIGDQALDLPRTLRAGLLPEFADVRCDPETGLSDMLGRGREWMTDVRHRVFGLLEREAGADGREALLAAGALRPRDELRLVVPLPVGAFTDFYASIHHASRASRAAGRSGEVAPNYRWLPVGYTSRASTVRASGADVVRPQGQRPPDGADQPPTYGPATMLDLELELGCWVGKASEPGAPVEISRAAEHIAGYCLLNDWSARDLQRWEMAPLGPSISKSFHTTISPWIVTADALAPFRVPATPRRSGETAPLPYLDDPRDQAAGGLSIAVAVSIRSAAMRERGDEPSVIAASNTRHLFWTPAQMLAHLTANGCDAQTGDLFGTGTLSGPELEEACCLLELTDDGRAPVAVGDETRGYLLDGDEVAFTARCVREGFVPIGFGDCHARVLPSIGRLT